MKKRLILASLGVMAILVGLAAFAANTAQWVNITARVEKEIAVACVDSTTAHQVTDCGFGTVFPQNGEEKLVEVALSHSFYLQTQKSAVKYWVLWECKLQDETKPAQPDPEEPNYNPCREDISDTSYVLDPVKGWVHSNPLKLDDNIRDYVTVTAGAGCLAAYDGPKDGPAKLEGLGDGIIDNTTTPKCFYHLAFAPPACEGSYNPATDPLPASKVVACNEKTSDKDPQKWDVWTDLGDNFKIQVWGYTLD